MTENPTPEPTGETPPEGVTPVETAKPEPDWKGAFTGLQENLSKAHLSNERLLAQNAALASGLASLRTGQSELVKATLGEDKAREMQVAEANRIAQDAQRRAAAEAETLMRSQANVILGMLEAAGVDPRDPSIDWGDKNTTVAEWESRVKPQLQTRIQQSVEARIAKERGAVTAKSAQEITAEAEALLQRRQKEEERIDTAKGQASTGFLDRVRAAQSDPKLLDQMIADAKSGRLRI